jgi:hypothetical protein
MLDGGNQVEQHDADAERLGARDPRPQLLEAGERDRKDAGAVECCSMRSPMP